MKSLPTPQDWDAWVQWLARRKQPQPLRRLVPTAAEHSPLLWGIAAGSAMGGETAAANGRARQPAVSSKETAAAMHAQLRPIGVAILGYLGSPGEQNGQWAGALEQFLERPDRIEPDLPTSLEILAWCHALPDLAQTLTAAPWCALLEKLRHLAQDAAGLAWDRTPLASQLLGGELPLTLAYLLPEIDGSRRLWKRGASHLSCGIEELLDGEGLPHGRHLDSIRPLLASWTRAELLGVAAGQEVLDAAGREQYAWLLRQALRLTRDDGSAAWSTASGAEPRELFRAALHVARDAVSDHLATKVLPPGALSPLGPTGKLPEISLHSEWSEAAVLQQSWDRGAARLLVSYHDGCVRTELLSQSRVRWSGVWDIRLTRDGRPLALAGEWEEVCWVSDSDGDYLELQADLPGEGIVQRQLYLAREDSLLLLADAVLGTTGRPIEYVSSWPLVEGQSFHAERETQEGELRDDRRGARLIPLALSEWRAGAAGGVLRQVGTTLQLEQRGCGARLFAPLFVDLDPRRLAKPVTWRQLTVAERLAAQSRDVAVGYRVQVGDRHWLVYRSLADRGNRTVLGQNFSTTFVLARIRDGQAEKLIEIE